VQGAATYEVLLVGCTVTIVWMHLTDVVFVADHSADGAPI